MIIHVQNICLLSIFVIILAEVISVCPPKCVCDSECANCTLSNKSEVPTKQELDNIIVILDLSWNNITSLPEKVFWYTRIIALKAIYLKRNSINNLSEDAFFGLKHLEYVDLSFNNISHISLKVFNFTKDMKWLSLAHNPLVAFDSSDISLRSIDLSFCFLTKILNINAVEVNLENNNITKVGKVNMSYIHKLDKLKLSHNPFICDCDWQDFMDLLKAHEICPISECSHSGDVTYNMRSGNCTVCPIHCECYYSGIAKCIKSNLEEIPNKGFNTSVISIDLSYNKISRVKNYTFFEVKTPNLRYISLKYNRISAIELDAFKGLLKLEYLDLSFNSLTHLYDISFHHVPALSWLSISGNILSSVSISSGTNVTHVDFSNCGIKNFTEVAKYWGHSLTWLNLKENKISFLFREDLEIMKSIKSIDISGNPLACYVNLTDAYLWLMRIRLAKNATCSLPRDLNGKYWQALDYYWINETCPVLSKSEISSTPTSVIILIITTCILFLISLSLCIYICKKSLYSELSNTDNRASGNENYEQELFYHSLAYINQGPQETRN